MISLEFLRCEERDWLQLLLRLWVFIETVSFCIWLRYHITLHNYTSSPIFVSSRNVFIWRFSFSLGLFCGLHFRRVINFVHFVVGTRRRGDFDWSWSRTITQVGSTLSTMSNSSSRKKKLKDEGKLSKSYFVHTVFALQI